MVTSVFVILWIISVIYMYNRVRSLRHEIDFLLREIQDTDDMLSQCYCTSSPQNKRLEMIEQELIGLSDEVSQITSMVESLRQCACAKGNFLEWPTLHTDTHQIITGTFVDKADELSALPIDNIIDRMADSIPDADDTRAKFDSESA